MAFRLSVAVSVFRRSCSSYRIVPGSRLSVVEESWQRRHITCALVLFPSAFEGPFRSWHSGQTWVKPNLYQWGGRVRSLISKGVGPNDLKLSVNNVNNCCLLNNSQCCTVYDHLKNGRHLCSFRSTQWCIWANSKLCRSSLESDLTTFWTWCVSFNIM